MRLYLLAKDYLLIYQCIYFSSVLVLSKEIASLSKREYRQPLTPCIYNGALINYVNYIKRDRDLIIKRNNRGQFKVFEITTAHEFKRSNKG